MMRFIFLTTFILLVSWASAAPLFPLRPVPISASPLYHDPSFFPSIFSGARYVRHFLNPTFRSTIGKENLQRLDTVINQFCLCVSTPTCTWGLFADWLICSEALDPTYQKTCQKILAKLDSLAGQNTPVRWWCYQISNIK